MRSKRISLGGLLFLMGLNGVVLASWTQQPGPAEHEIPVSWSPKLHLRSLNDVDAALGGPFWIDNEKPFRVQPEGKLGVWVTVRNCQDYVDVVASGDFDVEAKDRGANLRAIQSQGLRCLALRLLKNTRPARQTFLADFRFTESVGDLLPPDLGVVVSPDEELEVRAADKKGISWKQFDETLNIHVHSKDEFMAKGDDDGYEAVVSLYARGDFDGKGIEELLLRRDGALTGGTYRSHSLFILTRTSHHGPLRVVRGFEFGY